MAEQILSLDIGGNSGLDYLLAIGIFIILSLLFRIFKSYILRAISAVSSKTKTDLDDAVVAFISSLSWPFYTFIALFAAARSLALPPAADRAFSYALLIIGVYYGTKALQRGIDYITHKQIQRRLEDDKNEDTSAITVLSGIIKVIVWVIAGLLLLSNLGVNITSLVAGLGIGGIAIAFALQNVLEDLFSSFTIYFDKPFKKGDFIVVGQDSGTVQNIGIKSTRLTTLQGDELVISNRELTSARVHNYKRMQRRRVTFSFGVEYATSVEKLQLINRIIAEIFKKTKHADLDRVHFKEFGSFNLNYEVVYYLNSREYEVYMDVQQQINLAIKEQFARHRIEMAFPTQTVHVKK
ncbi:MAG TPA: mechanosensitive ion channel family protein [Candidatus Nanoarchaeia archaeon]|nr:mechanosensitive ion channel family protein [Candidatus Nanoarchaeia archaeon]